MGKEKAPRRVGDKEALSVGTQIRGSAQKLNLVAALIRGRKVDEALNILSFSKRAMASSPFSRIRVPPSRTLMSLKSRSRMASGWQGAPSRASST